MPTNLVDELGFQLQNTVDIIDSEARQILLFIHSHKIMTKQQGWPRGVSSAENPRQAVTRFNSGRIPPLALTGFYSRRMAVVHLLYLLDIPCEVSKGLTKC